VPARCNSVIDARELVTGSASNIRAATAGIISVGNSAISIRRSLLETESSALKKVNITCDHFYFLTALLHGRTLICDPAVLTVINEHGIRASLNASSLENFVRNGEKVLAYLYADSSVFMEMARGTAYEWFAELDMVRAKLAYRSLPLAGEGAVSKVSPREAYFWLREQLYRAGIGETGACIYGLALPLLVLPPSPFKRLATRLLFRLSVGRDLW
jgi:hypothetical protein